ncbi:MAG: hypothetical protein ACRD25_04545 [Terracidiphilus sp.]
MTAPFITVPNLVAGVLALVPYLAAAFFPAATCGAVRKLPLWTQLACPSLLSVPYVLVAGKAGDFRWSWFALYALLPVAITMLLWHAAKADVANRGNWRDLFVLASFGAGGRSALVRSGVAGAPGHL